MLQATAAVLLLAGLLTLHSVSCQAVPATVSSLCGPDITFFPRNREEFNVPTAWGRAAQRLAGNTKEDELLNVVLLSKGNLPGKLVEGVPSLQVMPSHPLLTLGATGISDDCLGASSTTATTTTTTTTSSNSSSNSTTAASANATPASVYRRRLSAAAGPVTTPATFRVSYSLNGSAPVQVGAFANVSTSAPPTIKLAQLASMPDGFYCMLITVEVVPMSGVVAGSDRVPLHALFTQRVVCFQKLDDGGKAEVAVHTCSEAFNVSISNIAPQPAALAPASDKLLFRTVVHIWANMNRTYNNEWPTDSPDPMFFEHWVVLEEANNASILWVPESMFFQGWYNLNVEVSLVTDFPSLFSSGITRLPSFTEPTAPDVIKNEGVTKFAGSMPYNGTLTDSLVGVQYTHARFLELEGPQLALAGTIIDFTWRWDGFGHQYCYIDGRRFQNDDKNQCRSPISPYLPDSNVHTLLIFLQDVCNNTLNVTTYYGVNGYRTETPQQQAAAGTCYAGEQCGTDTGALTSAAGSKLTLGTTGSLTITQGSAKNSAGHAGPAVTAVLLAGAVVVLGLLQ